jgi:hypothetical protein
MKFIITESKRESAVINWLNKKYSNLTVSGDVDKWFIDEKDNVIFLYNELSNEVTVEGRGLQYDLFETFGLKRYQLNQIVKPWLEKTYGIDIDMVWYTTYHCNRCGKYHPTTYHIDE